MTEKLQAPVRPLRGVLVKGAIWMVAARWGMRLIGMASTIILARLLVPADFGLVAMASIVLGLVDVLFAYGVDTALIQNSRAGKEHFDTAWTLRILHGIAVAAVILAVAPLAAAYFQEPRIVDVLRVLCIAIVMNGFANIGVVKFRKELRFEKEFQLILTGKLLGFAATVTAALLMRSYWALVIGQVVGSLLGVAQTYLVHSYRPSLSLKAIRELWAFSYWMLLVNMAYYALTKIDEIIVGGQGNGSAMGIYSVASEIAELPTTELAFPLSRTLLPGYAVLKDDPERLKLAFLNTLGFVSTVAIAASFGIAVVAEHLVPVVLGEKWLETIPLIQCLAIFAAIRTVYGGAGTLLIVLGRVRLAASLTFLQVIFTVCAVVAGMQVAGIIGVALAKVAVAPVFCFVLFFALVRVSAISRADIGARIWRPILAGLAMVLAFQWFATIPFSSHVFALLSGIPFGALVYTGTLFLLWWASGRPNGAESFLLEFAARCLRER